MVEYLREVPKHLYCEASGRPRQVLLSQADRYGFPLRGATINVWAVLAAFHDFLRDNAHKLGRKVDSDELMNGGNSPALEQYRLVKTQLAQLELKEKQQTLLPRDGVLAGFNLVAGVLRSAGEAIQQQYGPEPYDILVEALDEAERTVAEAFGEPGKAPE